MTEENPINPPKIDTIYDSEIEFKDILENPILQPISEIKSSYESQSRVITKGIIEFDEIHKAILEMFKANPVYDECIIIGEFKDLNRIARDVIHSQEIQISFLKQTIKKMLNINGGYYSQNKPNTQDFPYEEIEKITNSRGRPKKVVQEIEEKEVEDGSR